MRFKCLIKVGLRDRTTGRFENVVIGEDKGLNKQEAKKRAAKNAIRDVAPVIFKEVFGEEATFD